MLATIQESYWGRFGIPIAIQEWKKRSRSWALHAPDFLELMDTRLANFDGGRKFRVKEHTSKSLLSIASDDSPIVVIPVRSEIVSESGLRTLAENEFDLDLASMLWMMTTHMNLFISHRFKLEATCLGEEYDNGTEVVCVGFTSGSRIVNHRAAGTLTGCHRVIGIKTRI